jgi:hypothetical protein
MTISERLAGLNHTELYQLCHKAGIEVPPHTHREEMAMYLTGELPLPVYRPGQHPIHSWRLALQAFIRAYWSTLGPQIKCPAKDMMSTNPHPCFGCLDAQVMVCVTKSQQPARVEERYYDVLKTFKPPCPS